MNSEDRDEKIEIEGVILVISCQKHKETRLKKYGPKKNDYNGWKVIYVLGDFFLDKDYILENNIMTIKTEDSYIHLLKKLVLAIKFVNQIYKIKQGILRCGDDLIFNEKNLLHFLSIENKPHYIGHSPSGQSLMSPNVEDLKELTNDYWMVNYYQSHMEDFNNPQHNLKGVNISDYIRRPKLRVGAAGSLVYLSNYSCSALVDKLEEIKYNIFHYDDFTKSYPYTIEDCAVSFILYLNRISFFNINGFYNEGTTVFGNNTLAITTNEYK